MNRLDFQVNEEDKKDIVASKEAREANYWLRLLRDSQMVKGKAVIDEVLDAIDESNQIKKILSSVVKTCQGRPKSKKTFNIQQS